MGSYGSLRVSGYELGSYYGCVDSLVATVFVEADRICRLERTDDVPPIEWTRCAYQCSANIAADRLEVLGFTAKEARKRFEDWREQEIRSLGERLTDDDYNDAMLAEILEKELQLLEPLSFDSWLETMASVVNRGIHKWDRETVSITELEDFLVSHDDPTFVYPNADSRLFLRAVLLALASDVTVELDYTDLVYAGYYAVSDSVVTECRNSLLEKPYGQSNIIILTEGSSDIRILQCALECLLPHLREYINFFDFNATRARGGAPALVDTVKALAAARVSDRFVVLFDNDTAGHEAMRALSGVALPKNIRCFTYPDIDLARAYPTLGPSGSTVLDVNGLAGSIELYLGKDVLTVEDSNLVPIQWRGYSESLKRYQGELPNKTGLQARFFELVEQWKANPAQYPARDWSGLRAILESARTAHS